MKTQITIRNSFSREKSYFLGLPDVSSTTSILPTDVRSADAACRLPTSAKSVLGWMRMKKRMAKQE
jgi:hypothetical protein